MKTNLKLRYENTNTTRYLGYDDYEDVDEESLLFQQGFDGYPMKVEDGAWIAREIL